MIGCVLARMLARDGFDCEVDLAESDRLRLDRVGCWGGLGLIWVGSCGLDRRFRWVQLGSAGFRFSSSP